MTEQRAYDRRVAIPILAIGALDVLTLDKLLRNKNTHQTAINPSDISASKPEQDNTALWAASGVTNSPSLVIRPGVDTTPDPSEITSAEKSKTERYTVPFIFKQGDPDKPYLYLTVDDCWEENLVNKMLINAEASNVRLTFFPVAAVVKQNPDFWRDVLARGHGIYNHTIDHPNLTKLSYEEKKTQILGARKILEDTLKISVPVFRPPYGAMDTDVQKICQAAGIKIAMWTIMSQGWKNGAHNASQAAASNAFSTELPGEINGGIICMHAINPDINAVSSVIQRAQSTDLRPITMQEGLK